jgi:hypothetical protein
MESEHIPAGHETEDANVHAIVLTGVGLAIGAALVGLIVYGIFKYLANAPVTTEPVNPMGIEYPSPEMRTKYAISNPMAETDQQQFPPPPRIQEHPSLEVKDLHAKEDSILSTYGWTDKKAGVVRIPIDRAMELQLQRGFPTRQEAKQK